MSTWTRVGQELAQASWSSRFASFVAQLLGGISIKRKRRALNLCESLSLGERRFLAIVQCEDRRFLVGVTNQSISLLQQLPANAPHVSGLRERQNTRAKGESA